MGFEGRRNQMKKYSEEEIIEMEKQIKEAEKTINNINKQLLSYNIFIDLESELQKLEMYVSRDKKTHDPILTISKKEVLNILMDYFLKEDIRSE